MRISNRSNELVWEKPSIELVWEKPSMFEFISCLIIICYVIILVMSNLVVANSIVLICIVLFALKCIFVDGYRKIRKKRYRIATNDKKYFVQYLEKEYIFFGEKVWKDSDNPSYNHLETAKKKLEELVGLPKEMVGKKKNVRKHVDVDIEYAGIKIPF